MRRLVVPHLAVWVLGAAVMRVAVVPPEACPPASAADVESAAAAAGEWLVRNLDAEGRFLYGYDLAADEINTDYNIVRHGGAVMSLYQLAAAGHARFLEPADHALRYLLQRRIDHEDWSAVAEPGRAAQLGTAGFTIVALVQRRRLTADETHDELMRRLGHFVVAQRELDGSLRAYWDRRTEAPIEGSYGPFATGEALWALVELDNTFPGEGWWEAGEPTFTYLASGRRERKEGYLARLPDHWAAYALGAAGPDRLDDSQLDYVRRLAGYFSLRLRIEAQRTGEGVNLAVRWYPGPPAGVGTAAEGLAALERLAYADPRLEDLREDMVERMACAAGTMVERQVDRAAASAMPRPGLAEGAWFYRTYTQVDGQQHVLSGLLGAADAMRRRGDA
jgi:hypothetical protein